MGVLLELSPFSAVVLTIYTFTILHLAASARNRVAVLLLAFFFLGMWRFVLPIDALVSHEARYPFYLSLAVFFVSATGIILFQLTHVLIRGKLYSHPVMNLFLLVFLFLNLWFAFGFSRFLGDAAGEFATVFSAVQLLVVQVPFAIAAILLCLKDARSDLVNRSRTKKLTLALILSVLAVLCLFTFGLSFAALFIKQLILPNALLPIESMMYLSYIMSQGCAVLFAFVLCPLLLMPQGREFFSEWEAPEGVQVNLPVPLEGLDAENVDREQLDRLLALMAEQKVYRQASLSVSRLAEMMGVREAELRVLINRGLGFRNFNRFLNDYRLNDAKAMLSSAEHARLPILTIAMDLGFGTSASFNRLFKEAYDITPSEFRAEQLPSRRNHLPKSAA